MPCPVRRPSSQRHPLRPVSYPVPANAGPHDVAPAADGTVWYTAQGQGALGRLDPATKAVKVWPLSKRRESANLNPPAIARDGVVWFTGEKRKTRGGIGE